MVTPHVPSPLRETETEKTGLRAGTLVAGKLRIVRLLGSGGMGAVYEVEHELTKHRRALKLLHPEIAKNEKIVTRFLREASAAGHIGNPHIAETFDAGTLEGGEPYLVMEMLKGETLELRLERTGHIDVAELAGLVRQACTGVQAAHDAGIVHRDLKPENLFITRTGEGDGKPFVKILDFGISKFDEERTGQMGMTAEGAAMGTPYYMPPEQVKGEKEIDGRADVYALGVILYQCACGKRPFDATTLTALAVLIHEGNPVRLEERRAGLPPGFADVVRRAMAVKREDRFAHARDLSDALAPFADVAAADAFDATLPVDGSVPRIVVTPSMRPPAAPVDVSRSDRPTTKTSDAIAMGRTVPTIPPAALAQPGPGVASPSRSKALIAVVVVAVVGVLAFVAMRGDHATRDPSTATSVAPPATSTMPPAAILPPSPAMSSAAASSSSLPLPAPSALVSARSLPSGAASAVGVTGTASARPKPTGSTRVDQKGLAGENPF